MHFPCVGGSYYFGSPAFSFVCPRMALHQCLWWLPGIKEGMLEFTETCTGHSNHLTTSSSINNADIPV